MVWSVLAVLSLTGCVGDPVQVEAGGGINATTPISEEDPAQQSALPTETGVVSTQAELSPAVEELADMEDFFGSYEVSQNGDRLEVYVMETISFETGHGRGFTRTLPLVTVNGAVSYAGIEVFDTESNTIGSTTQQSGDVLEVTIEPAAPFNGLETYSIFYTMDWVMTEPGFMLDTNGSQWTNGFKHFYASLTLSDELVDRLWHEPSCHRTRGTAGYDCELTRTTNIWDVVLDDGVKAGESVSFGVPFIDPDATVDCDDPDLSQSEWMQHCYSPTDGDDQPVTKEVPAQPTIEVFELPNFVGASVKAIKDWAFKNRIKVAFVTNTAVGYPSSVACQVAGDARVVTQRPGPGVTVENHHQTTVWLSMDC